jgi:hypothetical protein
MYYNCRLKVTINGKDIYGITELETSNDSNNLGASCDITMPLNYRLVHRNIDDTGKNNLTQPKYAAFNVGDYIVVKAKYDGLEDKKYCYSDDGYVNVFEGFIYDFTLGTPFKIKCLDYVYWFRLGSYGQAPEKGWPQYRTYRKKKVYDRTVFAKGVSYPKVKFKELINDMVKWVNSAKNEYLETTKAEFDVPDIEVYQENVEIELENVKHIDKSPAAILAEYKKNFGFFITFIGNKLYVNQTHFTDKIVRLKTDVNVLQSSLQSNNLANRHREDSIGAESVFNKISVKVNYVDKDGKKQWLTEGDLDGEKRELNFYTVVGNEAYYRKLALEAIKIWKLEKYSGEIEVPLYPYLDILWKAEYIDKMYDEKSGGFVCTRINYKFGEDGFHKKLRLAWLDVLEKRF